MNHPSTEAHRFTTDGPRVYVRGDCPRCRHATSDAGPPDWQPARVVEYIERNADGEAVAYVNELQPCPWTLCPRRWRSPATLLDFPENGSTRTLISALRFHTLAFDPQHPIASQAQDAPESPKNVPDS